MSKLREQTAKKLKSAEEQKLEVEKQRDDMRLGISIYFVPK